MKDKKKEELNGLRASVEDVQNILQELVPVKIQLGKNLDSYYSNKYIPITGLRAVPIEESSELLSGNIGKTPEKDNTEINSDIKESESSYSVEVETT